MNFSNRSSSRANSAEVSPIAGQRLLAAAACTIALFLSLSQLRADTTIVNDTFSDNSVLKTGSLDLTYYTTNGTNASISTDSSLDPNSGDSYRVMKLLADRTTIAPIGQTLSLTTTNVITLSFDYRYTTVTAGASGNTIRVGLMNDNGTAVVDTASYTNSNDDYGVWATFSSTSTAAAIGYVAETGASSGIFAGSDRTYSSTSAYTFDTSAHHVVMTYSSLDGLSATLSLSVDGTTYGSYTTTALPSLNVNEFALTTLTNNLEIDNLIVTQTVPEPSTVGLMAMAFVILAGSFRRSWRKQ